MRRLFLWGRNDRGGRGVSLLNWETACLPKRWGGLGLRNIDFQNIALLLCWWWRLYQDNGSLWQFWAKRLRAVWGLNEGPRIWIKQGSYFWTHLLKLESLFQWSSFWEIRDGSKISFWYDKWLDQSLRAWSDALPRPPNHTLSLAAAVPRLAELNPQITDIPMLSVGEDILVWRWGSSGQYEAKHTLILCRQEEK